MRNGRHRAAVREGSVVEELLRATREVVSGTLVDSLRLSARRLLHRFRVAIVRSAVGGLVAGFGVIMLLIGMFQALRMIPMPDAAAYAIVGVLALGGGAILLLTTELDDD